MEIERRRVGAHSKQTRYALCADAQPTGAALREIVAFDSLELAAMALRYMNGGSMSEADENRVKDALKKADAPTVESKRTRKAD